MKINAAEIETIVRRVLESTRSLDSAVRQDSSDGATAGAETSVLSESVVTLETVSPLLGYCKSITVSASAVVTPAVKDELRTRGVALLRATSTQTGKTVSETQHFSETSASGRIVVFGPKSKVLQASALTEDVKFNSVASCGQPEPEAIEVQRLLKSTGTRVLWCSSVPYAAMAVASRVGGMAAIYLPILSDFRVAIAQSQPDVLIVDDRAWSAASLARLARNWTRSWEGSSA